jgi:hypothetical protein
MNKKPVTILFCLLEAAVATLLLTSILNSSPWKEENQKNVTSQDQTSRVLHQENNIEQRRKVTQLAD